MEILPVYSHDAISVVITPHKEFTAPLAVLIQSIIENGDVNKHYDIIILHKEIEETNQKKIESMAQKLEFLTIRFFNIQNYTKRYRFFTKNKKVRPFMHTTYYRLLIPELLIRYEKVIYIDADIILMRDIAGLWEIDITDFDIGAVKDICSVGEVYNNLCDTKDYRKKEVLMKEPENYFNAGVLLLNLQNIRNKYSGEEIFKIAEMKNWRSKDQDILNYMFSKSVRLLDLEWNLITAVSEDSLKYMPEKDVQRWNNAKENPNLIHFASKYKPWNYLYVPYYLEFWKFACKTDFIETILLSFGDEVLYSTFMDKVKRGKIGIKQLIKLLYESIKYKWSENA